jgi:hypothetical protein
MILGFCPLAIIERNKKRSRVSALKIRADL